MGVQNFILISSFFSSYAVWGLWRLRFLFTHLAKIAIKCKYVTRLPQSLAHLNKERVTVDSGTKFVVNLRNIQGVMSIYSRKKNQTFVTVAW